MLNKEFPNETNKLYLVVAVTVYGLLLLFLIWRAYTGLLVVPGRLSGPFIVLTGGAIWVACFWPLMWLIAEYFLHSHRLNLHSKSRKILYVIFMSVGIFAALVSILVQHYV